jgi:NADPH2:quinone reductase
MRAVIVDRPGGPERLTIEDRPIPRPGPGEVLIEVQYAGISRADCLQRAGNYPVPAGASDILGLEVSGTIAKLGEGVSGWKVGDPVCALLAGGGYAEYAVASADLCLPLPSNWTLRDAASLPGALCTAWFNVMMKGALAPEETVLLHGGASGVGAYASQLFAALGHQVLTTAGTVAKCRRSEALGAARSINYRTEAFDVEALAFTKGRGVDVILDILGAGGLDANLRALADDGRMVGIAALTGGDVSLQLWSLYRRRLSITGSTLRSQSVSAKERIVTEVHDNVLPLIEAGKIVPVVDRCFPLQAVADAHRYMEAGSQFGKLVLSSIRGGGDADRNGLHDL